MYECALSHASLSHMSLTSFRQTHKYNNSAKNKFKFFNQQFFSMNDNRGSEQADVEMKCEK